MVVSDLSEGGSHICLRHAVQMERISSQSRDDPSTGSSLHKGMYHLPSVKDALCGLTATLP